MVVGTEVTWKELRSYQGPVVAFSLSHYVGRWSLLPPLFLCLVMAQVRSGYEIEKEREESPRTPFGEVNFSEQLVFLLDDFKMNFLVVYSELGFT